MGKWTDVASWVGPTVNQGSTLAQHRGLVLHIAEGFYAGTIAWQKNPAADVSSHFIVSRGGDIGQMVDTDREAWTQRAGNSSWLSVEMEGFPKAHQLHRPGWEALSAHQVEAAARLLVRCNKVYGVPFALANDATGKGLGYHAMGGPSWGHQACPGAPIIGQRGEIIARARAIAGLPDTVKPPNPAVGKLDEDGELGPLTIRRWQRVMGTPVDGKISEVSELVKAVQRLLRTKGHTLDVDGRGIRQDGRYYLTTYALQGYLGTERDGRLSVPVSQAVKKIQRRLNTLKSGEKF